jgi:hypothetical protein
VSHAKNLDGNLAALDAYQAQQDKLEVTQRELEAAQVRALVETLGRVKATKPSEYTGIDLVSESLSEHALIAFRPLAEYLRNSIEGHGCLADAVDSINLAAIGRMTFDLIWPYLTDYAERNAEDYLPSVDGPERED